MTLFLRFYISGNKNHTTGNINIQISLIYFMKFYADVNNNMLFTNNS